MAIGPIVDSVILYDFVVTESGNVNGTVVSQVAQSQTLVSALAIWNRTLLVESGAAEATLY